MTSNIERRLDALLPDPTVRERTLAFFAESVRFVRTREPLWRHVRLARRRLRLFAGRLIVLALDPEGIWLATDPASEGDLSGLRSWRWDQGKWARYRRVPSRNGYYMSALDGGADPDTNRRRCRAKAEGHRGK